MECKAAARHVLSFPTRRSSDLPQRELEPALPIVEPAPLSGFLARSSVAHEQAGRRWRRWRGGGSGSTNPEETTAELQSGGKMVCRLISAKEKPRAGSERHGTTI